MGLTANQPQLIGEVSDGVLNRRGAMQGGSAGEIAAGKSFSLRWADIDWQRSRIRVRSPKTEHHQGGDSRMIPLFPELLPYLRDAAEVAPEGAEYVITRYRTADTNLRTQLQRIIRKASLEPWPKLFHNLRATRQTELEETFPSHVVCAWIGNSEKVARQHYLQTTEEHFERAVQNTVHPPATADHVEPREQSDDVENSRSVMANVVPCGAVRDEKMGDAGLEQSGKSSGKTRKRGTCSAPRSAQKRGRKRKDLPGQTRIARGNQHAGLLIDAIDWIGGELSIRPAGIPAAVVSGVLRALNRDITKGTRPSCTVSFQGIAAALASELGQPPDSRQVAAAISWLKCRDWILVLDAGPGGGCYEIEWDQVGIDVRGGARPRCESPKAHGESLGLEGRSAELTSFGAQ
jgi:hypothetical protein